MLCVLQGRPIFSFSSLSPHTGDVQKDGRVSLTVMQDGFSVRVQGKESVWQRRLAVSPQACMRLAQPLLCGMLVPEA